MEDQGECDRLVELLTHTQDEISDALNQAAQALIKRSVQNITWHNIIWISLIGIAIILIWFIFRKPPVPTTNDISRNRVNEIAQVEVVTIITTSTPTDTTEMTVTNLPSALIATSTPIHTVTPTPTIEMTATPPETATVMPTSTPQVGSTWLSPHDVTYVYVPHGEFFMGSTDEQVDFALDICDTWTCRRSTFAKEQPQTEIYLDSFWIMQTEVTVEQYGKFIEAGGYTNQAYWSEAGWSWKSRFHLTMDKTQTGHWNDSAWNGPDLPIMSVNWFEAEAYANWLSTESGLVYTLPTEAQWEKAARGTDARILPWGNLWDPEKANSESLMDDYEQTAPVGSFPAGASPYDVLDMAGNVLEWTLDTYDMNYYKRIDSSNPVNVQSGDLRTIRGGAWNDGQSAMRTTYRYGFAQDS